MHWRCLCLFRSHLLPLWYLNLCPNNNLYMKSLMILCLSMRWNFTLGNFTLLYSFVFCNKTISWINNQINLQKTGIWFKIDDALLPTHQLSLYLCKLYPTGLLLRSISSLSTSTPGGSMYSKISTILTNFFTLLMIRQRESAPAEVLRKLRIGAKLSRLFWLICTNLILSVPPNQRWYTVVN